MLNRSFYFIIGVIFIFSNGGCSRNLNLLLKIDKEDKELNKRIRLGERYFDLLLEDIKTSRIDKLENKQQVLARYREPVLKIGPEELFGQAEEKWLYRYPTKFFNAKKVYFYFNQSGELIRWQLVEEQ